MATNPRSVFGFLLREAGYVEADVAKIAQVGVQVAGFVASLPPVSPTGVFGTILKLVGIAENEIPKILNIGATARTYADILQQIEGAAQEFQAGQEVTGTFSIYGHKYAYDFKPTA